MPMTMIEFSIEEPINRSQFIQRVTSELEKSDNQVMAETFNKRSKSRNIKRVLLSLAGTYLTVRNEHKFVDFGELAFGEGNSVFSEDLLARISSQNGADLVGNPSLIPNIIA